MKTSLKINKAIDGMLKIKYIPDFDNGYPALLIAGLSADYLHAAKYLTDKKSAMLNDPKFVKYYDTNIISHDLLKINEKECAELAEIFQDFGEKPGAYHDYYETEALGDPDDAMLIISIREYNDKIFEEALR